MPGKKKPKEELHQAVITGTPEQLEEAAKATNRKLLHVAASENGAFATDKNGPRLLEDLSKTLGQQGRATLTWDDLTRSEKDIFLKTAAGEIYLVTHGTIERRKLCVMAQDNAALIDRIFPKYRLDARRCQLGLLEGCDTTGKVEAHVPEADLYACIKCLTKDTGRTTANIKALLKPVTSSDFCIHRADIAGHVCP